MITETIGFRLIQRQTRASFFSNAGLLSNERRAEKPTFNFQRCVFKKKNIFNRKTSVLGILIGL